MADRSSIEWTDATWNPVTGCTEVSQGCDHCYAKTFAERWRGTPGHHFENGFDLTLRPERHVVQPDGRDRGKPWPGWKLDQPDAVVMERAGKKAAGRVLDGRTHDDDPTTLGAPR